MSARDQILESATRLMAARGFEAMSLQAIADEVGIRKPSILYHFESKEVLRRAVLDRLLAHWGVVLPRLLMASARDGAGRFEALMGELVAFFAVDAARARLLVRELLDRPASMRAYLAEFVAPWIHMVADQIRKSQARRLVAEDIDPEAYVVQVVALTLGSMATAPQTSVLVDADDPEAAQVRCQAELIRTARVALFGREPRDATDPDLDPAL